jgi:hypothetical protein
MLRPKNSRLVSGTKSRKYRMPADVQQSVLIMQLVIVNDQVH